ncbi:unnamed protein product [Ceutorhynchus assimilis]|uniref:Uncharacterized protein n=1 Tax=Ceutorhynchus assimilis TaxID=467358 RepID=A0A9N9MZI9_9CUCU|nr:unnamed protein product [Ceutorhynchus assimilis]
MKSPQIKSIRLLQECHQENVEVMLKNLLKDETLSDITLHCKDGAVRAHRVILAASSPYFKKVFQEHPEHQVAFLLHGMTVQHIKSLVELMYRGSTQIASDMTAKLSDIAEEFGIKGIVDEKDKSALNIRDTRFKGQKRVTVDFENDDAKTIKNIRRSSGSTKSPEVLETSTEIIIPKQETEVAQQSVTPPIRLSAEARRRNNWAMKQRKYKCTLCPASFKRASHLSRHQLVHTGERPYACSQCDKAFSRHDKLKHHIKKTHEHLKYIGNIMEGSNDFYPIGQTTAEEIDEEPKRITREDLLAEIKEEPDVSETAEDLSVNKAECDEAPKMDTDTGSSNNSMEDKAPQKKGRGRPRKYPVVPRPLVKRPRGRPRLNQSVSPLKPGFKLSTRHIDDYDITNMPFGDLEYLTKPLQMEQNENSESFDDSNNSMDDNFMEPLVEIELDKKDKNQLELKNENKEEDSTILHHHTAGAFLQNIGLLETSAVAKMELGECTISVSNGPPPLT